MTLPECPPKLSSEVELALNKLAEAWAKSNVRPRIERSVLINWNRLIEDWILDRDLPLFIRKWNRDFARGQVVIHNSGRKLVPADNTLAHWAFATAFSRKCPSISEIRDRIEERNMPVALALKKEEKDRATFKALRASFRNPNKMGWRVCHKEPVNLGRPGSITSIPMEDLKSHFRRFISPSNMFLVPKFLGGMGELPSTLKAISIYETV